MIRPDFLLWQIAKGRNRERMRDAEKWRLSHWSPQPTWLTEQIGSLLRWLAAGRFA